MIAHAVDTTLNFQSLVRPDTVFTTSLISSHQFRAGTIRPDPVGQLQPDWVTGVLVVCFILFAWTQVFYSKRVRQVLRAPFSQRFLNQLTRDGNLFSERISLALGTIYFLAFPLLIYELNVRFLKLQLPLVSGITLYGFIILFLLSFQFIKVLMVRLLGIVFKTRDTTAGYLLNMLIFMLISAPVLLSGLVFILYLKIPALMTAILILLGALFLFRFFRGFFIGMTLTKFSYLLLFVYLCTLEILPLLVIAKILINWSVTAGG